jgi:catechol 2,3-dioxygenase-like lactoylglutathione lyase family enzyme
MLNQNLEPRMNILTLGVSDLKRSRNFYEDWGGPSGYFTDPDGHLWEIAWNPHFKLNRRGELELP